MSDKVPFLREGPKQLKSEIDSKRVRVKGIIKGTEEAIVQQAFEKHASVKQVLMDVGATEAVVEFADAAVRFPFLSRPRDT